MDPLLADEAINDILLECRAGNSLIRLWQSEVPTFTRFKEMIRGLLPVNTFLASGDFTFKLLGMVPQTENHSEESSLNSQADFFNMFLLAKCLTVHTIQISLSLATKQPSSTIHRQPLTIDSFYRVTKPHSPMTPITPVKQTYHHNNITDSSLSPPILNINTHPRPTLKKPITQFQYNDRILLDIEAPTSCKRKLPMADSPLKPPTVGDTVGADKPKSRRKIRQEEQERGEHYPGATTKLPIFEFNPEVEKPVLRSANWVNYITGVGQEFRGGVLEFRDKLIKYSAKLGFHYKYAKNDATYVRAYCSRVESEGCQWHVRGSVSSVTEEFTIKEANLRHTCKIALMRNESKRMGQKTLGNIIQDLIRAHPTLTAIDIQREIKEYWAFTINYDKIWRSLEVARASLFGGYNESFDELRWYADAILRTNPGSVTALETEPEDNRFKRFFVAFDASLQGFKSCRPMLFIDGTFMKSRYKGTLLGATAKDGNNGLFPVAMAIVSSENTDNWTWFLGMLKQHVHHDEEIAFVSDRAAGLMNAFDHVYDRAPNHFFCIFHLMKNLRAMYAGKKYSEVYKSHMCKLLRDTAYAPNMRLFESCLAKFKHKGGAIAEHFLVDLPPSKWAVAFTPSVHMYGDLTSNAAESFNEWIKGARSLPVTFMLDCIRAQLMRWFHERRAEYDKWTGALTPTMKLIWIERLRMGENWYILPTDEPAVYEVISSPTCVVDLNNHKCSCYQWQVEGFPCVHAIACINSAQWDIKLVVQHYFWKSTYRRAYGANIYPIPTTEKYEFVDLNQLIKINPPVMRRAPGRPKDKRHRSRGERNPGKFLCGRCGKYGTHYWTTCAEALDDSPESDEEKFNNDN